MMFIFASASSGCFVPVRMCSAGDQRVNVSVSGHDWCQPLFQGCNLEIIDLVKASWVCACHEVSFFRVMKGLHFYFLFFLIDEMLPSLSCQNETIIFCH